MRIPYHVQGWRNSRMLDCKPACSTHAMFLTPPCGPRPARPTRTFLAAQGKPGAGLSKLAGGGGGANASGLSTPSSPHHNARSMSAELGVPVAAKVGRVQCACACSERAARVGAAAL